jgi:hypothetical protein
MSSTIPNFVDLLVNTFLPSFAEGHGCEPVDECEAGTRRSLGEGGCASAFAVRSRLRPTEVGGFRPYDASGEVPRP